MEYFIITTDQGLGKGGIQTWAYYMKQFLQHYNLYYNSYCIKEDGISGILNVIKANFSSRVFILMDWQKIFFAIIGLLLASFGIVKSNFIIILHGNEILNLNALKRNILRIINRSKHVFFVANSKSIGALYSSLYGRDVDCICNPFIDTKIIEKNRKNKTDRNEKILFSITRLVKRKNLSSVIIALNSILSIYPSIKYYIAGDGPELNNLNDIVKSLSMSGNVIFLGNISDEEKSYYYSISDLFVLPSLFDHLDGSIEGFGIVFIEANMYGVPVISGNTGGMREAVLDGITGFCSEGSVEDIKKKIERALKHNFNKKEIVKHAEKFDYRNQISFAEFLESKSGLL